MWEESEWKLCYFHMIMNAKDKLKALGVLKETYFFYLGVLKEMKEQKDENKQKMYGKIFKLLLLVQKESFGLDFDLFYSFFFPLKNETSV